MQDLSKLPALLLPWFAENARVLPWRENTDPYRVWISEIMLQQTRVEAAVGYYRRFLAALPDIDALARVSDDELMKLWEGLGYYSRARNLKKAANEIVERFGGRFPSDFDEIRSLPGVGEYTAGAISSICFERPTPAVDGNVLRVFARYTAWEERIDGDGAKRYVTEALRPLYPAGRCGAFTQSLMELGACVCIPNGAPDCARCPLRESCRAYAEGKQTLFPLKAPKKQRRVEDRLVLILRCGDRYAIRKRPAKGLLAGLWEFPGYERDPAVPDAERLAFELARDLGAEPIRVAGARGHKHIFTHVEWRLLGVSVECGAAPDRFVWATGRELRERYALPGAFHPFLEL